MITYNQKNLIIRRRVAGKKIGEIAEELGLCRQTVSKYLKRDGELREKLQEVEVGSVEFHQISEEISGPPVHKSKNKERKKLKYTDEIDRRIDEFLENEERKDQQYGKGHKLNITAKQIHEQLIEEGHDISYSTVCKKVRKKKDRFKETFIKQHYEYGQRCEFDFGERKITIDGKETRVYVAVLAYPASGYRDFYLYLSSGTDVFLDSQVHAFERAGGVCKTVVYDNMKNVVKRFVGPNEKELTDAAKQISGYYQFEVILTNIYAGNEKGTVESAVKVVLRELFNVRDEFDSFAELIEHSKKIKKKVNKGVDFESEKACLGPYRVPLEVGKITENRVNKYAFVRVDKNDYSVPEEYNGAMVTVKAYPLHIEFYYKDKMIARHARLQGKGEIKVEIEHYYKTLLRKPGALYNSEALYQVPQLKNIFEDYYIHNPREFLQILIDNKDRLDTDQLVDLLSPESVLEMDKSAVVESSRNQLDEVASLFGDNDGQH